MGVKRTTLELDEALTEQAVTATGATLRATVERGLRLVVAETEATAERRRAELDRYRARALNGIDLDVLLSGEAWR